MSETKCTPGPWHIDCPNDSLNVVGVHVSEDWIIADMCGDVDDLTIDQHANASLIAAAPDLYEALDELKRIVLLAIQSGDWKVDGALDPDAALNRAVRAANKARGES